MTSRADAQSNASNSTNTDPMWPNSYSTSASDSQRARPTTSQRRPGLPCVSASRSDRTATLEEVGDLVGVSSEAVRLWETGQRTPSETHRVDYIDVLADLRTG
jgi:DNA-binding transcriptional regulator YiaG